MGCCKKRGKLNEVRKKRAERIKQLNKIKEERIKQKARSDAQN